MSQDVKFLLVEDDEVDAMVVTRAFKALKIANPLTIAKDGVEALEILRGLNNREKLQPPYIVILDLNMPRMTGLELLQEIRSDPDLKSTVVFVMTTSDAEEDRISAYNYNIAGYIVKSDPTDGFLEAITMLDHFWRIVELP